MQTTAGKEKIDCPPATSLSVIGEDVKGNGIKVLDESGSTTTAVSICATKSEINNPEITKRNPSQSSTTQATSTPTATITKLPSTNYNILSNNDFSVNLNIHELNFIKDVQFQVLFGCTFVITLTLRWLSNKFNY